MIHLSLASTLHQGRTTNSNWITVIYVSGYELNIRLSSVVYSKFACPGEAIQREYEWPGRKKNNLRVLFTSSLIPTFFLHEHVQNPLSDIFLGVLRMRKKRNSMKNWKFSPNLGKLWHIAWNCRISLCCNTQIPNIQIYKIYSNSRVSVCCDMQPVLSSNPLTPLTVGFIIIANSSSNVNCIWF